jgi:hypothetical protein
MITVSKACLKIVPICRADTQADAENRVSREVGTSIHALVLDYYGGLLRWSNGLSIVI